MLETCRAMVLVGAIHELPRQEQQSLRDRMKRRRQMLLPKIIGRFKMISAKQIHEINNTARSRVWHRDYYEHIIRSEQELSRVWEYKFNNPAKWRTDEYD